MALMAGRANMKVKVKMEGKEKVEEVGKDVEIPSTDLYLPLKSVQTKTIIHESLAHVALIQKFLNPTDGPLEITYSFPK